VKNVRPWFNVCFFWLPMAVTLLLNPGRNAINIPQFSILALLMLAVCGLALMFYSVVGLTQPRVMSSVFLQDPAKTRHMAQFFLSLLFGLIAIYYAAQRA
jgi:hypothetical protein